MTIVEQLSFGGQKQVGMADVTIFTWPILQINYRLGRGNYKKIAAKGG